MHHPGLRVPLRGRSIRATEPLNRSLTTLWTLVAGSGGNSLEALMRSLTFTCPQTGRAIDAGVATDPRSLASVQAVTMRFQCPCCGMFHQFPIRSGYLAQPFYWPSTKIVQTRDRTLERRAQP
jgi:predicted RNA-binding Zn-ribbon protein involved in translation (DUF1610 family)